MRAARVSDPGDTQPVSAGLAAESSLRVAWIRLDLNNGAAFIVDLIAHARSDAPQGGFARQHLGALQLSLVDSVTELESVYDEVKEAAAAGSVDAALRTRRERL